ncbi:hypothetical protein [Pseudomonas sp. NPDC089569]|uniref:hypothetical protein n=1 Tax=Pseudomonas sp. NPDC089569 TaxID=3390722 RepID=UPI003D0396EC
MPADKPRKIELREFLVPGHHDALLAVLHLHHRKAGNQLVLSISEACLPTWPLSMSDYEPPSDELLERTRMKFTIREDRHPNLYRLYRSIGLGSKGQIFCNLFNRHQMIKAEDPEGVNAAVTRMHERQLGVLPGSGSETKVVAAEPAEKVEIGASPSTEPKVESPKVDPLQEDSKLAPAPEEKVRIDPLAEIPPMQF